MSHRQFLRLAVFTAFVFFIQTSTLLAQRERTTVLYDATGGPGGKITGKLTDESGPVKGVKVSLIIKGDVVLSVVTGDNGTYTFSELLPGIYEISCYKYEYRKKVINQIPVIETYLTNNDITMTKARTSKEERTPVMEYYDDGKNHKLQKM